MSDTYAYSDTDADLLGPNPPSRPEETTPSLTPGGSPSLSPEEDPTFLKQMQEMRLRAGREGEEATRRAKELIERNRDVYERREAELEPLRKEQLANLREPLPSPPTSRPLPDAPKPTLGPNAPDADNDHAWLTAAMFLGSLGGALTRNHVTNALAGFSGAVQGYNEGKKEIFHQQMEVWRAENEKALRENERSQRDYENILRDRKLTMDQKMLQVQISAQKYDDEAMFNAAQTKDTLTVAQLSDQRLRYGQEMRRAGAQMLQEQMELARQEVAGTQALTQRIAEGKAPWPSQNSGNAYGRALAQARINAVLAINPNASPADYERLRAGARISGGADAMVERTERMRRVGTFTAVDARQVAFQNAAVDHLETLRFLTSQLNNTDINFINEVKQRMFEQAGIEKPTNFDAAKTIVGREIVKALTPTGGAMYDRKELDEILSRTRSPQQLNGITDVFQRLIAAQTLSRKRQYDFSRLGIPNAPPFEAQVSDRVKRLMATPERIGFEVPLVPNEAANPIPPDWAKQAKPEFDRILGGGGRLGEIERDLNATARGVNDAALEGVRAGARIGRTAGETVSDVAHGQEPSWLRSVLPAGWHVRPMHHLPGSAAAREEAERAAPSPPATYVPRRQRHEDLPP